MKKRTYEEVLSKVVAMNLTPLFDKEWFIVNYINTNSKIDFSDKLGYKYSMRVKKYSYQSLWKFHRANPYTLENIELYLKLNAKPFKLVDGQEYVDNLSKLKWFCNKCNQIFECTLTGSLSSNSGCGVCKNKQILKGFNSLAALEPDLTKYFKKPEDADNISPSSNQIKPLKCPRCGYEKEMIISRFRQHGFSCPQCSDGVSVPNKFVFNILSQLSVNFKPECKIMNYRYDFYLPDLKITIEAHGMQHYEETKVMRSLQKEQEIDKQKRLLSESSGNIHIEIDCRKSNYEYLKSTCIDSLSKHFNLSTIDWGKVYTYCNSSLVVETCGLWDGVRKISDICGILKLCDATVRNYLIAGAKIGLCSYSAETKKKNKKVVAQYSLNGDLVSIFCSASEAGLKSNLACQRIATCCRGKIKTAGGYIWKFM